MKSIAFAQAGFIQPILNAIEHSGVNLAPIKQRAGLGSFDLKHSESYLPFHLLEKLASEIELDQGISSLANQFHKKIVAEASGDWCSMIAAHPSLLQALQKAEKLPDVMFSNEQITLRINGKTARYDQQFRNIDTAKSSRLTHINAALLLNTFKDYLGDNWEPLEVHFQSETALDMNLFFPGAKTTRVYVGMPSTAIILDAELLLRKLENPQAVRGCEYDFSNVPKSFSAYIDALLSSTHNGTVPTIKQAANFLDTSERSLRRALAAEYTSYAEIVDNWRRHEALLRINDSAYQLEEIAEYLGYSYAPNFFRAFKRWTNCAPREYRELK